MMNNKSNSKFSNICKEVEDQELDQANIITVIRVVCSSLKQFRIERAGQILGSAFILIMLWGYHGELDLLRWLWDGWQGPGSNIDTRVKIIPGLPWDQELISFWAGAILLVGIPIILIKCLFKQKLSDYGLGLPPKRKMKLAFWSFIGLTVISLPAFYLGAQDEGMREVYPFYKSFSGCGQFLIYQLTYLPFFIAIEFIFRGYLLFGLAGVRDEEMQNTGEGTPGVFYFHRYAILIQMLSYTAWHLGKPIPELWGTLVWGLAAGAIALAIRSVWPIILSHWLLNVFLDALIAKP